MTEPELRLLRIEMAKLTAVLTQLVATLPAIAHDVRATRERINTIEARIPFPRRKRADSA